MSVPSISRSVPPGYIHHAVGARAAAVYRVVWPRARGRSVRHHGPPYTAVYARGMRWSVRFPQCHGPRARVDKDKKLFCRACMSCDHEPAHATSCVFSPARPRAAHVPHLHAFTGPCVSTARGLARCTPRYAARAPQARGGLLISIALSHSRHEAQVCVDPPHALRVRAASSARGRSVACRKATHVPVGRLCAVCIRRTPYAVAKRPTARLLRLLTRSPTAHRRCVLGLQARAPVVRPACS